MRQGETVRDRFVLVGKLGAGSNGHLYEAFDTSKGNSVAVKFPVPQTFESDSSFQYFVQEMEREAELLRKFSEVRGIPDLIDDGPGPDGSYVIVMRKVDGKTLKDYAESGNSPMEVQTAVSLVAQLSEILGDVHDRGYVHRDVKPENAMIDSFGNVHLVDLGAMLEIGKPGYPAGTNRYAAPEQVHQTPVATSADVFPLGCMLTEMTTLTLPYPENYLMFAHRGGTPPEPVLASLAPQLTPVVAEMVAWDPERRPQGGRAAFQALRPFLPVKGSPRDCKVYGADPTARYRAELK